ncbi:hypothetical protein ACFPYJ_00615 [Paenibacillus solisilvae]|uniref:Uncharacterized protein n=1 Tax=Paenibacillus solisilvae TaxID=2486751 RepID=A0ABW0VTX4_9BACL
MGQDAIYDFSAGRKRIENLILIYRRLKHTQESVGTWDWILWNEIEEIEAEIAEAKKKMTSGQGDYFEKMPFSTSFVV